MELIGAEFGALFSGRSSATKAAYTLYALSGIDRESFEGLPLPREMGLLGPILDAGDILRWDDITTDPRYVEASPGVHAARSSPVRSYLAVPLVSRAGEVIGALFFGHSKSSVFTERAERIMQGIAAHAAIAIEKASLFQAAQQEIETRRKAEESLSKSKARFREFRRGRVRPPVGDRRAGSASHRSSAIRAPSSAWRRRS